MGTSRGHKAILVVSFGTSYPETRKLTIEAVEDKIRAEFPDYVVRRAFSSKTIMKKIAQEEGIIIDSPRSALERLMAEGFEQVLVQPLHIIAGYEYDELIKVIDDYKTRNVFDKIALGEPVLYAGDKECGVVDDYTAAVKALKKQLPRLRDDEAVVLMGHGTRHAANVSYALFQEKLDEDGLNVFIGTVEASPSLEVIKNRLQAKHIKRVTLMPYMLVAGDHAQNDLAGDEDDAWKVQLHEAGYKMDVYMHGLGENSAYQDIYVRKTRAALRRLSDK
jgi:sirohydrochlorin cobaltochelatase